MRDFTTLAAPVGAAQRIGILLDHFSTGGSERVAIRLANRWAAAGRDVTLYCVEEEGPVRATVTRDVAVVAAGRRGEPMSRATFGRAVARLTSRTPPDVLVAPGNYHIPILSAAARAMSRRRPALVAKLSNPIRRPDRTALRQRVFEAGLRWRTAGLDRIVAMCPSLAEEARVVLGRRNVACLAEPTLDADVPPPGRTRKLSGLVLAIGRLTTQKNLQLALEAIARTRCDVRLAILGEGEDYDALYRRAEALGIADRVRFVGFVADVRPWLAAADVLLCTSLFEGYPAALVEAIAHGLPVVTTPCSPALPEILSHPTCGRIVPAEPGALAAALEQMVGQPARPSATALAAFLRHHDADRAAAAWLAMLDATVAARGHGHAVIEPRRPAEVVAPVPVPA